MFKRKYEKKLTDRIIRIPENREFIITHLKKEWEEIERSLEKKRRKEELYRALKKTGTAVGITLLALAALGGIVVIAAVAPKIFSAFGRRGRHRRYFDRDEINRHTEYLRRRKYIEVVKGREADTMEIKLTELGEEHLVKKAFGELKIIPQQKWDGIWRIIIFDIPEKRKWAREGFRQCLKRMGFYPLQKSAFVFPYPCKEEIAFLGRIYDSNNNIRFLETKVLSYDRDLKEYFALGSQS